MRKRYCLLALVLATGCRPVESPSLSLRTQARLVVLNIANALHVADEACAAEVMSMDNSAEAVALGEKCVSGVEKGRDSLLVAEKLLDTWDDSKAGDMYCAAADGLKSLENMEGILKSAGVSVSNEIENAISVVGWLGRLCEKKDGG